MSDLEEQLNAMALTKLAEESGNKYLSKIAGDDEKEESKEEDKEDKKEGKKESKKDDDKDLEKEAFAAAIASGARKLGKKIGQSDFGKKHLTETSKRLRSGADKAAGSKRATKGYEGTAKAVKKDATNIIKKNPLKATAAVGATGLAGGAALSD